MPDRLRTPAAQATDSSGRPRSRTGRITSALSALAVVAVLVGIVAIGNRLGPRNLAGDEPPLASGTTEASASSAASAAPVSAEPSSAASSPSSSPDTTGSPTPIVARAVVPRPGVPLGLRAKTWLAEVADNSPENVSGTLAVAGIEGTTARIVLPRGELGVGAEAGIVASALAAPGGAKLIVRDISSGTVLKTIQTSVVVNHGLLVGQRLFWVGFSDVSRRADGGVWTADLSSPDPLPRLLERPVKDLSRFGENVERGPVQASASGRTVSSTIGGLKAVRLDVIDVQTGAVRASHQGLIPLALTDGGLLVLHQGGLALRDIVSGKLAWSLAADLVYDVVADHAGRGVVLSIDLAGRYVIEEVDLATGKARPSLSQDHEGDARLAYLVSQLSSFDDLALLPQASLGEALGTSTGQAVVGLLRRSTGALVRAAFKVGAP